MRNGGRAATPLAALAEVRRAGYRLLGSLFLYPGEEQIAEAVALGARLRAESDLACSFPWYRRWRPLLDSLAGLTGEQRSELEDQYIELFVVGASQPPCVLYESAYADPSGRNRGAVAAEVGFAYEAAGVALSDELAGELPDHASLELEFVSCLCSDEARAWRERLPERAVERLDRQQAFLDGHLLRWFPSLVRRIRLSSAPGSFYHELAQATCGFLVHDRDLAGALSAEYAPSQAVQG